MHSARTIGINTGRVVLRHIKTAATLCDVASCSDCRAAIGVELDMASRDCTACIQVNVATKIVDAGSTPDDVVDTRKNIDLLIDLIGRVQRARNTDIAIRPHFDAAIAGSHTAP